MSCACNGNAIGAGAVTHGKPGHAGRNLGVPQTLGPRGQLQVGISAAGSFADAQAKYQHGLDLANNANSVGEYLQAANYAAQAAHEASDLDPGSAVVSGYAATADLGYNQIVSGGSTMDLSAANASAVTSLDAAGAAISQAQSDIGSTPHPGPRPNPEPPPPQPVVTGSGSPTQTAAVVVAVVAAGVAGYYGWRYLKKSRRRAGAPRRRRR